MVKVTFNTAFAQKDVKKDSETLIPDDKDPEVAHFVGHQSRAWCWCFCLGLALMLSGLVVGGAYLYRYYVMEKFYNSRNQMHTFTPQQSPKEELLKEGQVFVCGVKYREEDFMIQEEDDGMPEDSPVGLRMVGEHVRILQDQEVELINVPVPEFSDSDPADIVHDFNKRLTAYLDLSLNKCYVIPLNTSVVMPPRDFVDLLINIKAGTYLPQTYMVREQMMVTEKLDEVDQLGYFINRLCREKDTYRLQRRETILGMQKREALSCHKIRHFENKFVVETMICEP